jgi:uncharacterized surface protein with fasciclin (FAS1) repeats
MKRIALILLAVVSVLMLAVYADTKINTAASIADEYSFSKNVRNSSADKPHQKHQADIVDTAVAAGSFQTLVAAVKAAGLVDVLKGDGPYTVFAPTDEAFAKLPHGTIAALLKPENREKLVKILTYHVVPGKLQANDVVALNGAKTVQGQLLKFRAGSGVHINNSKVVKADIAASNGVIHVIDTVLLPE